MHDSRKNLRVAIRATDANEAAVRAASAQAARADADLAVERMKLYGKITTMLAPDQQARYEKLKDSNRPFWQALRSPP